MGRVGGEFLDQVSWIHGQTDLLGLLLLTLISLLAFRFLVVAAEGLIAAMAGMVRLLSGGVLPVLLIILILLLAFSA